jgi:hypothetical protein
MAIDLVREQVLRPTQAARWLGRRLRRPVHVSTVYRWFSGLRGRRLEFVQIGGTRVTTVEALERFFAELASAGADGEPRVVQTSAPDAGRDTHIEAELEARGL